MSKNVIEKYYQIRKKSIVKCMLIMIKLTFNKDVKLNKNLDNLIDFFFKNFVLKSGYSKKEIRKYNRFFIKNQITDVTMQNIIISIFETFIDYNEISEQSELLVIYLAKLVNIALNLDELTFNLEKVLSTKDIIIYLNKLFNEDKTIKEVLTKSKKDLQLLIKSNQQIQKKLIKLLNDETFQLEYIPYEHNKANKPIYEVVLKYYIDGLSKYQSKEIDLVISEENLDNELSLITYTLAVFSMMKLTASKQNIYLMIPIANKFFQKKKNFKSLIKLMANENYCQRIILEIDALYLESYAKEIEVARKKGTLIAIRKGNSNLDPNDFDIIVIKKDDSKIKDLFKRFSKLAQITIISDVNGEENSKNIDYIINNNRVQFKDLIKK